MARIIAVGQYEAMVSEETLAAYSRKRGFGSKQSAFDDILVRAKDIVNENPLESDFQHLLNDEINQIINSKETTLSKEEINKIFVESKEIGGF